MSPAAFQKFSVRHYYQDQDDDDNLSTGAVIGIVVGIIAIKIAIVAAVCYMCKRRERRIANMRRDNALYNTPGFKRSVTPDSQMDTGYYPPTAPESEKEQETAFLHQDSVPAPAHHSYNGGDVAMEPMRHG